MSVGALALVAFGASMTVGAAQPALVIIAVAHGHDQMLAAAPVAALAHAAVDLGNTFGPIMGGLTYELVGSVAYTAVGYGALLMAAGVATAPLLWRY